MYLSVEITREGEKVTAYCPELALTGSGDTEEKAIERLKSIIYFYIVTPTPADTRPYSIH